jgi:quercetin dioxygenase-like cupin family protein
MPYVGPEEAPNSASTLLLDELRRRGAGMAIRLPIVSTPQARCVLIQWPAGHKEPAHRHPRAVEVFLILKGNVRARFGSQAISAGPGVMLFASANQPHSFDVSPNSSLAMLAIMAPNEDVADESVPSIQASSATGPVTD